MLFVFTVLFAATALAQSTDGGVCGWTPQVRDTLLAKVQANDATVTDCSQVTAAHLQALTGTLDLSNRGITSLKPGDLTGLTNLATVFLSGNRLRGLPDGIFASMTNLQELYLHGNYFETLSDGVFMGLANLRDLYLNYNNLRTLPDGIFEGLANLRNLYLYDNDLRTLPDGIFDDLANLRDLYLNYNNLRTLPDGIFDDLANLRDLYLENNPGTDSFLPTAAAGADQKAVVGTMVRLDGSASRGGPWGTNITYDWAVADGQGNPVTDLTLTGGDTATPSFTMPATEPDGGLVFTLSVQGKGHRGLGLYKSTASVRVAIQAVPAVTSVVLTSVPTNGTTYGNGESIEVVVTFEQPATVDISGGTPSIGLTVGAAAKTAGYTRGSGGRNLVFAYEVQASDTDTDGVSVPANSLTRNGGRIGYPDGTVFRLTHNGLSDDISHKVSGAGTPLTGGICGRTSQVRVELLRLVQANDATVTDCSQVTAAHLQALTGTLDLSNRGITSLKPGDLTGLTNLATVFLSGNQLTGLPDGIFASMTNLQELYLHGNYFQTLSDGVFMGLANLRDLYLNYNNLNYNDLRTLPDGIFEGLANLRRSLYLENNPGTDSFLPTAAAGADQKAVVGTMVRLDGSASRGGPWGTNITYDWAVADGQGNPVTDLTLTGGDTATPSFTMPATEPDGGLVFTLSVQGKGHRGLGLYKSTASVRVAIQAAPAVISVVLTSAPANGTTYGNGESIEVVVTFEQPATVDISGGTPSIGLTVGAAAKTAGYTRGSGGRNLVFAYEVQASDTDTDGVSVPANSLTRNGGRIGYPDGTVFRLTHNGLSDDISHKVSGAGTPLTGGICGRTSQVRVELLRLVQANDATVTDCSQVTAAHLQALTGTLDLSTRGITSLKPGDLTGLTNLATVILSGNQLTGLPDGIFDDLANLRDLYLNYNNLRTLPDGIFDRPRQPEEICTWRTIPVLTHSCQPRLRARIRRLWWARW